MRRLSVLCGPRLVSTRFGENGNAGVPNLMGDMPVSRKDSGGGHCEGTLEDAAANVLDRGERGGAIKTAAPVPRPVSHAPGRRSPQRVGQLRWQLAVIDDPIVSSAPSTIWPPPAWYPGRRARCCRRRLPVSPSPRLPVSPSPRPCCFIAPFIIANTK